MRNLKILAWLHLSTGALTLLVALFFAAGVTSSDPDVALGSAVIGAVSAAKAVSSLLLGWGLLALKRWSRLLGMIVSVLNLPFFPVGTGIGIFGLLVLADAGVRLLLEGYPETPVTWG